MNGIRPETPSKLRLYAYILSVIVSGAVAATFGRSVELISADGCRLPPDPEYFVSYCQSKHFGDYEHDAFWFGTERAAVVNLKSADIIFTGSSRTMFAFSTEEIRSYFSARGLTFFNAGFGYEEQQTFFIALARKWQLRPHILVIGVDPYFDGRLSLPGNTAIHDPFEIIAAFAKRTILQLHPLMCRVGISRCLGAPTAFRSDRDGRFIWRDTLELDRQIPRIHDDQLRDFQINVPLAAIEAHRFLAAIAMPAHCVVLVPMPTHKVWRKPDPVKQLADAIGAQYIDADTGDDLFFLDDMHLSYESAKRFSAEFVEAFERLHSGCVTEDMHH